MTDPSPLLRYDLDYIPIQHEGKDLILVRDTLGLVTEGMALPRELFELLAGLDSTISPSALHAQLRRMENGHDISEQDVTDLLRDLDNAYLFQSPHFSDARERIVADFSAQDVRLSVLSGRSFPADKDALAAMLDDILGSLDAASPRTPPVALVAPHIELSVGRRTYAAAYNTLKGHSFDRVVVLGIGHQLNDGIFCLTDKDFETPLGRLRTDIEAVSSLRRGGSTCLSPNDFVHRDEHSLEFQLLFLQHILGKDAFEVVPILCGSLPCSLPQYTRQAFLSAAGDFLGELKKVLTAPDRRTLLVTGVDLCHIGPKFGHQQSAKDLEHLAGTHDKELLERFVARDPEGFWAESERIQDNLNVCGFSAMATLLEILPPCHGRVLDYQIWHESPTNSAVSFAAARFEP